jgi:DNA-binding transcriptional ArsR family regulator
MHFGKGEAVSLAKAELIIHPVRLRIIEALQRQRLTTRQIAARLPDVPQATLYRQIKRLLDGGVLEVAGESLVNGIVERAYALRENTGHLSREEFAAISPEDHARYFSIFLGALMIRMDRYLRQESYDTTAEGMTYFQVAIHLTDAEARQFRLDLLELIGQAGAADPGPGRRRRLLGAAFIPDPQAQEPEQEPEAE